MAAKHFTLTKVTTSISLFLSIFLMAFSCADHVVPENPSSASVTTVSSAIFTILGSSNIQYRIQFSELGVVPIIEHGVVRVVQNLDQPDVIPTINDGKKISSVAATKDLENLIEPVDLSTPKRIFYRAYALLQNGDVVYGEVKSRLNVPDNQIEQKIKTLDAVASFGNMMRFSVALEETGNIPVLEFGVLYSVGNALTPPTPPTEADNKDVFTGALTTNPSNKDTHINGLGLFVYYRAYAKLLNGNTIYGEVKVTGTTPL
jgi:hypothetical protein